ncbi:hybrid sensor histidine kinase/response regulator [Methylomonas sp. LL1]|uniref:hybrid sensor histidine kinase/response regulator n=1 Tax=Methylomonas sp. LL1 TaxID=2785785 RepID=UPI0018C36DCA|nr:hybrid sensor histidine kinase/response regulator [Methylomonas sp. LL1]QPK62624.1 hybrid sensor histidine kinase/response regulator [Methylomonas sp. LL1]
MITDPELHKLFKAESDEHLARLDDGLLRLEKMPADPELLDDMFRESHSLKGAARMLGLSRIEAAAHGLESIFNAARKGEAPLTPESIEQMNIALADLRQRAREALATNADCGLEITEPPADAGSLLIAASPIPQSHSPNPRPEAANPQAIKPFRIETVRVETRKLDDLLTQVGELAVIQGQAQHRLKLIEELMNLWAVLERRRNQTKAGLSAKHASVETADGCFGSLLKQARDAFFDDNARLESTVQRLDDQVSSMRLLPLSSLFGLFPRMVRDLAREQGKEVELLLEGGDITVDKRILEEMKDPLMHLLRNAIDHGIEPPDERARMGKPRAATLRLRAVREDIYVLLEVRDDGRGLDSAAIRLEAGKRGMLDDGVLASMTSRQIQQLIFTSGFSTSRYLTELSGRGVGLDVVRVNVERLKGGIRLESLSGQGLAVQMRLPLSLATTRLLLASVDGRLYGLPVESIHTSRRVRPEEIFQLDGRRAILLDGEPVIVAGLAELLEIPEGAHRAAAATGSKQQACVVLQLDHGRLGLLADELPGEEEVVPKPLGAPLKRVRNVSALAVLGDGTICPLLNPADLTRSAHKALRITELGLRTADAVPQSAPDMPQSKPAVLLAEDSALIRAMEKRILEDAHYEVVTAVDGLDALNLLGSRPFAAVVTDIVMPNMDGLTLTARIRAEPRHRNLPVILVTSLASDEDKRRGLDAGANAYIPKPTFDQRVLLDTLKRLI